MWETCQTGMAIHIMYRWPEAMFNPQHLFEGHVCLTGATNVNPNSAKAAALNGTKEKINRSDKDTVITRLVINSGKQVVHNFISLQGEVVKSPSFYMIECDSSNVKQSCIPSPHVIRCMVQHTTEGYQERCRTMSS